MTHRPLFLSAALTLGSLLAWGCADATPPDTDPAPGATSDAAAGAPRDDIDPAGPDGASPGGDDAPGLTTSGYGSPNCAWTEWQRVGKWCAEDPGCPAGLVTYQRYIRYYLCLNGSQQPQYRSEVVGCGCSGAME